MLFNAHPKFLGSYNLIDWFLFTGITYDSPLKITDHSLG